MDFKNYYLQQADGNYFRGAAFQRGYGLGGAFRRFFSWFVPILKDNAYPVLKNAGKNLLQSVTDIAKDTISGQDFEESSKNRIKEGFERIQSGKGYKRKRNLKNKRLKSNKIKQMLDIFS
jgi:hypothetical protein